MKLGCLITGRDRLLILIYHRVVAESDPLQPDLPTAVQFEEHLRTLNRHFRPIRLSQAHQLLRDGMLPDASVAITFDDGYADNAEVALPLLLKHEVPATFFVATGYLDGGVMFNDQIRETVRNWQALPTELLHRGFSLGSTVGQLRAIEEIQRIVKYSPLAERPAKLAELGFVRDGTGLVPSPMMRTEQVRELQQSGMEIGGHTVSHPILACAPNAEAEQEITAGKRALEQMLQVPVRSFAYPNGQPGSDYDERHVQMVKQAGFDFAVSTRAAPASISDSPFELPRIGIWRHSHLGMLAQLAKGCRFRS